MYSDYFKKCSPKDTSKLVKECAREVCQHFNLNGNLDMVGSTKKLDKGIPSCEKMESKMIAMMDSKAQKAVRGFTWPDMQQRLRTPCGQGSQVQL